MKRTNYEKNIIIISRGKKCVLKWWNEENANDIMQ